MHIFIYFVANAVGTCPILCRSARRPQIPSRNSNAKACKSQLKIVVEKSDFFSWLESRHADVGATITSKCISQATISTRSNLALNSKINLSKVVSPKFEGLELCISIRPLGSILLRNLLGEATSAVLACSATLASSWGTFGGCSYS